MGNGRGRVCAQRRLGVIEIMTEVFVTNFNRNFTGVSATAANVLRHQETARLVGRPLPGCPEPIPVSEARKLSKTGLNRPFTIWHVRRNTEMRAAIWARDVLRLPIKIVFTSAAQRQHSWFPRQLIARMDAVIATTPKAAEFVPHVKAVVPHGVDLETFNPAKSRSQAWRDLGLGGQFGIATVGRIRPEKGTDRFVEAMIKTLLDRPDGRALILGRAGSSDQQFLNDLKSKVATAGLSNQILFLGEIPADQMPSYMRAISLLVALPRYEGYGMTPLEAMASGTPFVATDTGFFDIFSNGGAAGSIIYDDAAAEVISNLLSDEERLQKMSGLALQTAKDSHSVLREVAGIQSVYDQLWAEGS